MTDVIELAKQLTAAENLHGMCSRLIWRIGMHQEAGWDVGTSYGNATAAYNACKKAGLILSTDLSWVNENAEVGWIVYFVYRDANNNGHVGIIVGRINGRAVMVSMTGNKAGFIADLGNGLFLSYVDGYSSSRPFLGISKHHGVRNRIERLTSPYAPVVPSGPNVRTVKSNANAFRRVSPDAGAALTPKDDRLKAGSAQTITKAYLTGKPITQNGTTTDVWFEVAAYGWAWAGGFTSQSLDGIAEVIDARPKPPPVVEPEPVEPEPADPDPVPVEPADPDPEEEPVAETPVIEVPVRVKLDDEALAGLLAKTKEAPEPSQPVVPDAVAKPLWVGLSMVAVSAGPVVVLTLIDWSAWDATIGQQFATTVTAWAGSIAAVLGLSRFAKSK